MCIFSKNNIIILVSVLLPVLTLGREISHIVWSKIRRTTSRKNLNNAKRGEGQMSLDNQHFLRAIMHQKSLQLRSFWTNFVFLNSIPDLNLVKSQEWTWSTFAVSKPEVSNPETIQVQPRKTVSLLHFTPVSMRFNMKIKYINT